MSQPDSASSAATGTASVGSLSIWHRRNMTAGKALLILVGSTLAAVCLAFSLSRDTHLEAAQLPETVVTDPFARSTADSALTIIPRGRDVGGGPVPGWQRSAPASVPRRGSTRLVSQTHVHSDHGAVLRRPDFNAVPPSDSVASISTLRSLPQVGHAGVQISGGGNSDVSATAPGTESYQAQPAVELPPSTALIPAVGRPSVAVARYGGSVPDELQVPAGDLPNSLTIQESGSTLNPGTSPEVPSTPVPAVPLPHNAEAPVNPAVETAPPAISDNVPYVPRASPPIIIPEPMHPGHVIAPPPQTVSSFSGRRTAAPYPGTSGFRATVESDAPGWISPYMSRTSLAPPGMEPSPTPNPSLIMPMDYQAWWDPFVRARAGIAQTVMPVDVSSLVQKALVHSPQVQVLQADPEVLQRIVRQEEAAFDWRAFLESRYDDLNDPIGNTLTTGNMANRFGDNRLNAEGGFKRRTESGGELRIDQQIGHQYNNSLFLVPNPQSTSRLELSFRQPLLSGAGTVYNQNQIILARISTSISSDETLAELQSHLFRVTDSYWTLYRARAEFFQRQKFLGSAQQVLTTLEGRTQVDTMPRQILRARAAVARAESRLQRAVSDIRNAESQLRLLVNDPEMLNSGPIELTPNETPAAMPSPTGLRDSLQTALVNRPDISRAIREMRASGVRIGVSRSELLPKLDFIVTSYVAGLENRTQIADSIGNQFTDGRPGYTIGFEFEVPLGNRAARAKMEQRQWELKRAISSFRATVEASLTEVEITSREVDTAYREMLGKYQAMLAAQNEVSYLQDRFEVLPMIEESSLLLLEDLLDGYERVADEESAFVLAQTSYALAIIQLRRATGTLLRSRYEAPILDPEESEWLTSRADQAASETAVKAAGLVSVRKEQPLDGSGGPPASIAEPVGDRAATPQPSSARPVSAPVIRLPIAPGPIGGHSFGRYR